MLCVASRHNLLNNELSILPARNLESIRLQQVQQILFVSKRRDIDHVIAVGLGELACPTPRYQDLS